MKKIFYLVLIMFISGANIFAQNTNSNQNKVTTNMNLFGDPDSLINNLEKMLVNELGGQLSSMNPQVGALFNSVVAPNINLSSVMNGSASSALNSLFGSSSSPNVSSLGPKQQIHLPPNTNPSKFNTKQELEREIVRCEGAIQSLQRKIAVNNSANNPTANSKLNHQVNMYEEEIQNYLNQIKDLEQ